jgi:large subunit ribosomal protein L24e
LKLEEQEKTIGGAVKMPTCSFCKESYEFPRGITVVQKDGNVRYFCSSKCRKNSEMGRDAKKVKWIRKSETVKAIREKIRKSKENGSK